MSCTSCGNVYLPPQTKTPYDVALAMAETEAKLEDKIYVVILSDDGRYYHDCLECRIKNNISDGKIVAYIR